MSTAGRVFRFVRPVTVTAPAILETDHFDDPGVDAESDLTGGALCLLAVLLGTRSAARIAAQGADEGQREPDLALMEHLVQTLLDELGGGPIPVSVTAEIAPCHQSCLATFTDPYADRPVLLIRPSGETIDDPGSPRIAASPLQLRALLAALILFGSVGHVRVSMSAVTHR